LPLAPIRCRPGPPALVTLGLPHSLAQSSGRAADPGRDQVDDRSLRGVLAPVIEHHPDRRLPSLQQGRRGSTPRFGVMWELCGNATGKAGPAWAGRSQMSLVFNCMQVEWLGDLDSNQGCPASP
jgi:hypothetical protein